MNWESRIQPKDHDAKPTILWQLATGVLSIALGGGIIYLLFILASKFVMWDNEEARYFVGAMASCFALVFLVINVTKKQFEQSLVSFDVFSLSVQNAFSAWKYATVLCSILGFFLIVGYGWAGMLVVLSEIFFMLIAFPLIGALIGGMQFLRLEIEGFDPMWHQTLKRNEASILACQSGVLPYYSRVRAFWHAVLFAGLGLVFIGAGLIPWVGAERANVILSFLAIGLGGVGVNKALQFLIFLITPRLTSTEELVHKRTLITARGITNYYLTCTGQKYSTNSQIWKRVIEGGKYRLWFSPINNHVVCFEHLKICDT